MTEPIKTEVYRIWRDAWKLGHPNQNPPTQEQFYMLLEIFDINPIELFI